MKKLLKPAIWIVILAVPSFFAYRYWQGKKIGEEEIVYRTAPVERQDVVVSVSAVGVLEPLTTVEVKANVAGEIVKLAVDRGDYVAGGDLIASIDPTETRTAYEEAQADLDSAMARVRETMADLRRQRTVTPAQTDAAADAVEVADARVTQAERALAFQRRSTEADIKRSEQSLEAAKARRAQAKAQAEAQPDLQKASVKQAEADVAGARQALARLKTATHPQEKTQAESALKAARVNLENDKKAVKRLQELHDKGFLAKQALEDAEKGVADSQDRYDSAKAASDTLTQKHAADISEAEARVDQAEASLAAARTGEVDITVAQREFEATEAAVREAEASLEAARAGQEQNEQRAQELEASKATAQESRSQLRVAKAGEMQPDATKHQVTQAEAAARSSAAQLENAQKNLGYTTIVAPRDGLVIDRFVEEGTVITSGRSSVTAGTTIVTLADVSRMFVLAEVDEADIGQVSVGQPVELEVETFRDETFEGVVTQVYPQGEEIENVTIFRVRIEVLELLDRLHPGMTAEASIIIDKVEDVLACPNEAIYKQKGTTLVDVLDGPAGEPLEVEVETGIASFEWTEVTSGLTEGQEVVIGSGGGGFGEAGGAGGKAGGDGQQKMRRMMMNMRKGR